MVRHDMAIRTGSRIVRDVRIPFGVDEGVGPNRDQDAGQQGSNDDSSRIPPIILATVSTRHTLWPVLVIEEVTHLVGSGVIEAVVPGVEGAEGFRSL